MEGFSYESLYKAAYEHPEYRAHSPSEEFVRSPSFTVICTDHHIRPETHRIVEFGAGTCRALRHVADLGFQAIGVDVVDARDDGCKDVPHVIMDLTANPINYSGLHGEQRRLGPDLKTFAICVDVMEHFMPGHVPRALRAMMMDSHELFLQIAMFEDVMTDRLGLPHPLHLTVCDERWWLDTIRREADAMCMRLSAFMSRPGGYFKCIITSK